MINNKFNKVFISYASEDFVYANKLYIFLKNKGLEPWMDKEKLLPGHKWDFEIQTNLRRADFVILLLSNLSVSKRGYVQKEFKLAVKICEEKLDSDIYIIPVKINRCEVPHNLSSFQWIEYNSESSFENIFKSISEQRSTLLEEYKQKELSNDPYAYVDNLLEYSYGDKSPKQIVEVRFPVFNNELCKDFEELNIILRKEALETIITARNHYFNYLKDLNIPDDEFMKADSTSYCTTSIHFLSKEFFSYTNFLSEYYTGAAHGYYGSSGRNYYLHPVRNFDLKELFFDYKLALLKFRELIHTKLMIKAKSEFGIDNSSGFYILPEGLTADEKNFDNYYFKQDSLVFIFNPYELTAFAFRDHHPEMSFDELLSVFQNEVKFVEFINNLKANKQ